MTLFPVDQVRRQRRRPEPLHHAWQVALSSALAPWRAAAMGMEMWMYWQKIWIGGGGVERAPEDLLGDLPARQHSYPLSWGCSSGSIPEASSEVLIPAFSLPSGGCGR